MSAGSELPGSIAVLGIGLMGDPIARRLIASGTEVTVWNRSPEKTEPLAALGARVAAAPAAAVAHCEAVILMLSDLAAVDEVLQGLGVANALPVGSLLIDMSSIPPEGVRRHAEELSHRGIDHLDAPVSGGTRGAEDGTLSILVGGSVEAFRRAQPILSLLGSPAHIGASGAGQLTKCMNQMLVGITIAAVAEAFVLAARNGIDPEVVRTALQGGFADSRILREHGARMVKRDFEPGGKVATQLKDLRTAVAVARDLGMVLPLTESTTELFSDLANREGGDLDHSSLLLEIERLNATGIKAS